MEINIKGYDGYTITTAGEVFSTKYRQKRQLKPRINSRGYMYVNLSKNGKYKSYRIHCLVANAFIPNPKNLPEINHIDGNKLNNKIDNLEWCTRGQNQKHAFRHGLIKSLKFGVEHPSAKLTEKEVKEIRLKYIPYKYTLDMLAKEYGVSRDNIKQIVEMKIWKNI